MESEPRLLKAARSHHQAGRWTAAEAIYRRIIDDEPLFKAVALHALGLIAFERGYDNLATDLIAKAIEADRTVAAYYSDFSRVLESVGHVTGALASAEQAMTLGDQSPGLLTRLFSLYLAADRPDDAIALAGRRESNPASRAIVDSDPQQRALRGRVRRILGDHAGARMDLTNVLAEAPSLALAWHELGRIERAGGNDAAAVACYDRALATGSDIEIVFDKGIALQRLGRKEEARSCFREATIKQPYALSRGADLDLAALADLDISPEKAEAVHGRGLEAERAGRHIEALALFGLASSLAPLDRRARKDMNRLLAQLGKRRVHFHFFFHSSFGMIAVEADLYQRRVQLGQVPDDLLVIFLSGTRSANRSLMTMLGRDLPLLVDDRLYYSMLEVLLPGLRMPKNMIWVLEYENYAHPKSYSQWTFAAEEKERGRAGLRHLGVDPDADWFVCVFARDDGWAVQTLSGLTDAHTYFRNADINSYHSAIRSIVDRGGTVIRIGAFPQQALTLKHPKVIDYSMTARDEFMDIYLVAHSRFLLGTPAGILDLGKVFDVPCLLINSVPVGFCPYGKHLIYVPKRLIRSGTGDPVPIAEYLEIFEGEDPIAAVFSDSGLARLGYAYVDNTPDEILEATEEMLDRLDGRWEESSEDRQLLDRYFSLFLNVPQRQIEAPNRVRQPVALSHLHRHRAWYFPED